MGKNSKGILLTLLTILLFILMLGILITFVVLNINANTLASDAALSKGVQSVTTAATSSAHNFVQESLSDALQSIIAYEGTPALRHGNFISDTASTFRTMMYNGTAFGVKVPGMTVTMSNYTAAIQALALQQGITLSVQNYSINVFQSTPYSINATYTALDVVNTSTGTLYYPVNVTAGIQLNGTFSLAAAEQGAMSPMHFTKSISASMVGGVKAQSGSEAPFMFVYGSLVVNASGSAPTCSSIPSTFRNSNFILAAANSMDINQSVCNMGGLITINPNVTTPNALKPYLVYGSSSGIFNYLSTGSSFLLDGPALELLNISAVKLYGIQKGEYVASTAVPSYIDSAEGSLSQKSPAGLFSLSGMGRESAAFPNDSYLSVPNANVLNPTGNSMSAFAWVYLNSTSSGIMQKSGSYGMGIGTSGSQQLQFVGYVGTSNGICTAPPFRLLEDTWYMVGFTYNGNTISDYVDGSAYCSIPMTGNVPSTSANIVFGGPLDTDGRINGTIAEVQLYNTTLSPLQVHNLYSYGMGLIPVSNAGLFGWWPLDGNSNDYSGLGDMATAANVIYSSPPGYIGDMAAGETIPIADTFEAQGVANCANMQQCSNLTLQHLYLGNATIAPSAYSPVNEGSILGLGAAELPNVLQFNGNGNYNIGSGLYMYPNNGFSYLGPSGTFSISLWVYPQSGNGIILDQGYTQQINTGVHEAIMELVGGNLEMIAGTCTSMGQVPIDQWTNIAVTGTISAGAVMSYSVYLNGDLAGTGSGTIQSSANPVYALGRADSDKCGTGNWYNGRMFGYQIYNSVLTLPQVRQLYVNGTIPGLSGSLIANWPLGQGLNGLMNATPDMVNGDTGYLWYGNVSGASIVGTACPEADLLSQSCAGSFSHP